MKRIILIAGMLMTQGRAGATWVPPIGIPAPAFGIVEQAPAQPAAWPNAQVNGYYYIDNTSPLATDAANTYGCPAKPLMTIPMNLNVAAGTVVEIHGGPYLAIPTAYAWKIGSDPINPPTAGSPAFIRGFNGVVIGVAQAAIDANVSARIECGGQQGQGLAYTIIEGIHFQGIPIAILGYTSHHSCIRNCEGSGTKSTVMLASANEPWVSGSWFTADASDILSSMSHGFATGDVVKVLTTGTLPAGLATGTTYYAIRIDNNSLKLAASSQNAANGIAIDITDAGVGSQRLVGYIASEVHDIVFYNNLIHDTSLWNDASKDWDYHGYEISTFGRTTTTRLHHVWVLDSTIYHCSGDGVQINANTAGNAAVHHVYIGRNTAYENRQSGFGSKNASDVIMSQNTIHSMTMHGAGLTGPGLNMALGPDRIWYIFNEIHDCFYGIRQSNEEGLATNNAYFIGNWIHDLSQDTVQDADSIHWGSPSGWGMSFWSGGQNRYIVDNTIENVYGGIETIAPGPVYAKNNIICNLKSNIYPTMLGTYRNHIEINNTGDGVNVDCVNSVIYGQVGGASQQARIKWLGGQYTSLSSARNALGKFANCIEANPLLSGVKLQANSPAIDAGVQADVYQTFQTLYGIDIRRGFDGGVRPIGAGWDIGACEYNPSAPTIAPPKNPSVVPIPTP